MSVGYGRTFSTFLAAGVVAVLAILIFAIWGRHPGVDAHTVKLDLPATTTTR